MLPRFSSLTALLSQPPSQSLRQVREAVRRRRELLWDIRHAGRPLGLHLPTRFAADGAFDHKATRLHHLEGLYRRFPIQENDILVDVGCGLGRVLLYWASLGVRNPIYGIELNPVLAEAAARNTAAYPNITALTGNVFHRLPRSATRLFLFHPFDKPTMERFVQTLPGRLDHPDQVVIEYYNPVFMDLFVVHGGYHVDFVQECRTARITIVSS